MGKRIKQGYEGSLGFEGEDGLAEMHVKALKKSVIKLIIIGKFYNLN